MSVLRICCVESSQGVTFALLKNISANGAQIEADIPDPVGAPVSYFFDDNFRVEADIVWKKDGRIGLANRTFSGSNARTFPRRALRVPLSEPAQAWAGGRPIDVQIANISQTGALMLGEVDLPVGTPITLELSGLTLHNVMVRWSAGDSAGVQFERPLHLRELKAIVEHRRRRIDSSDAYRAPAPARQAGISRNY